MVDHLDARRSQSSLSNRVKSAFIGFYPPLALALTVFAGWQFARSMELAWLGAIATGAPFLLFLGFVLLTRSIARTSAGLPWLGALAFAGLGFAVFCVFLRSGPPESAVLAAGGSLGVVLYSHWYSRLGRAPSAELVVGRVLPDLGLRRADGRVLKTSELRGKPALLMFYRGNWCPLCMAQVKEIAAQYRALAATGVRVLLISPQPHENTAALARRFEVPFDFVTDERNAAAKLLRIEMKHGLPLGMGLLGYESDTVFPTVIILDAEGVIRWVDQTDNYRIRPEPSTFLPLLEKLGTRA
ncbi:MAG: peroxiredoxin family protein [Archangium sp.]|nr:peroxiredoxin family protein [Archangium sp.]